MSTPLISHVLIGAPGSGKSTLAIALAKQGNYQIVSTDQVRAKLFGDAAIQGDWSLIQAEVLSQIREAICADSERVASLTQQRFAIASGQSVIYDATNAKRVWRMNLLMRLAEENCYWMGWYLQTPLETCKVWNQKRERQVPEAVIETMFKYLEEFPPIAAEGFAAVNELKLVKGEFDLEAIQKKINRLSHSLTNRNNRTKHSQVTLHRYSRLLDFERLLHLIALIIRYPGIGNLQLSSPDVLSEIFGILPNFDTALEEVCAVMGKLQGEIYADADAVADDLQWLEENGFFGSSSSSSQEVLTLSSLLIKDETVRALAEIPRTPPQPSPKQGGGQSSSTHFGGNERGEREGDDLSFATHAYSDIEPFKRLLLTIRFILHRPFLPDSNQGSLQGLVDGLTQAGIVQGNSRDTVRKDIEKVLKPYKILPEFAMRKGYFAGTGILSENELRKVFGVLQSQAKSIDDPVALEIYEMFDERMGKSNLDVSQVYPVRQIGNYCMIDGEALSSSVLSKNLDKLEAAIEKGELLELSRTPGTGRFAGDGDGFFKVWPLQMVFYNHVWYLACECEGGKDDRLLRFERLNRLFLGVPQGKFRERDLQLRSLDNLHKLREASAGLFLGNIASEQQLFLSGSKQEKAALEITVELWFNDYIFKFVAEGTKRYQKMKMSPKPGGSSSGSKSLFSLKGTGDPMFPNRFKATFPKWCLNDVDLWKWIVGFGGNVLVKKPDELVVKVRKLGEVLRELY